MVYNQELADYIKEQLNSGHSLEQIKNILIQKGWREAEVNEAINSVRQAQPAEVPPAPPEEKPPQETPPKEEPHKGRSKKKIILLIIAVLVIVYLLLVFGTLILSVILYQIGLFNPGSLSTPIATGFHVFGKPSDWEYSGTEFSIKLPSQTYDIEVTQATAQVKGTTPCDPITDMEISAGRNIELDFTGCGTSPSGSSYSADIEIKYTTSDMPLETVETGTVTGVIV